MKKPSVFEGMIIAEIAGLIKDGDKMSELTVSDVEWMLEQPALHHHVVRRFIAVHREHEVLKKSGITVINGVVSVDIDDGVTFDMEKS
jgi:hypothetical protein